MPLPQHPKPRRATPWGPLLAAAGGAIGIVVATAVVWNLVDPVDLVDGLGGGTLLRPERYCCGMLAWRASLVEVLATSAVVAAVVVGLRAIPILRSRLASIILGAGVVAGAAWIVVDVSIAIGSGLPDSTEGRRDFVLAAAVWLILPLGAALGPRRARSGTTAD